MNKKTFMMLDDLIEDKKLNIKNSDSVEFEPDYSAHVEHIYKQVVKQAHQIDLPIALPNAPKLAAQTQFILSAFHYLASKVTRDAQIQCQDCQNYESSLQKLENDIRQHIRLEQQLKLYQENLQQKIEEHRKEVEKNITLIEQLKRNVEEQKGASTTRNQKCSKLQAENERLKQELLKVKNQSETSSKIARESSQRKSLAKRSPIEGKENANTRSKLNAKKQDRKSVEKRPESIERWRCGNNSQSIKSFPLSQKLMQKNREDKRKAIQSKFQLRK